MHICISKLTIFGSDSGLSPRRRQAIISVNQCWNVFNLNPMNKIQWNFNQNLNFFIQENALENVVCEMAAILSRGRWVNWLWPSDAIWCRRTWSTLVQVMDCCLMAPSHYLKQCGLITSKVLCHSPEGNFTGIAQDMYSWYERERERLSLSAFLRTEDIRVHKVHISRLIITYTLE